MLCDLEIFYKGKMKKIKTMIDTGNFLKEPITQTDVIIVEKNSLHFLYAPLFCTQSFIFCVRSSFPHGVSPLLVQLS
jgi:hypothetical protein